MSFILLFFPLSLTANYFFEKYTLFQFVSPNILYACIKQWYDLYEHPFTWFALTWLEKVNSSLQVFAFIAFLFPDFHCRLTDRLKKKKNKKILDCYESFFHPCQCWFKLRPLLCWVGGPVTLCHPFPGLFQIPCAHIYLLNSLYFISIFRMCLPSSFPNTFNFNRISFSNSADLLVPAEIWIWKVHLSVNPQCTKLPRLESVNYRDTSVNCMI